MASTQITFTVHTHKYVVNFIGKIWQLATQLGCAFGFMCVRHIWMYYLCVNDKGLRSAHAPQPTIGQYLPAYLIPRKETAAWWLYHVKKNTQQQPTVGKRSTMESEAT